MKGSISASVVAPPMPGSSPTQNPTTMPTSMKANGFHCRTRSSPSQEASSIASFAELDVLGEFLNDVLRLVHHLDEDLLRLVAGREFEVHLRLLALGDELRIVDRLGESFAHHLDDVGRG